MAHAYSHLSERNVYVEFLENLAGSYPVLVAEAEHENETAGICNGNDSSDNVKDGHGDEGVSATISSAKDALGVSGGGGDSLAADLATHRARVASVLRRLPAEDAR